MRKPTRIESQDVEEGILEIEEQKEADLLEDLRYQAEMLDREEEYENFSFYQDRFNTFDDDYFDEDDFNRFEDIGSDFPDDGY